MSNGNIAKGKWPVQKKASGETTRLWNRNFEKKKITKTVRICGIIHVSHISWQGPNIRHTPGFSKMSRTGGGNVSARGTGVHDWPVGYDCVWERSSRLLMGNFDKCKLPSYPVIRIFEGIERRLFNVRAALCIATVGRIILRCRPPALRRATPQHSFIHTRSDILVPHSISALKTVWTRCGFLPSLWDRTIDKLRRKVNRRFRHPVIWFVCVCVCER